MSVSVHASGRPEVLPLKMSDRFRHEVTYFMTVTDKAEPTVGDQRHYYIRLDEARSWLDAGVFSLVSPLDSQNRTEIELSEEHEAFLDWLVTNEIEYIELSASN